MSASAFYAYVGNDPTDKTDPSGMYITQCSGTEKQCTGASSEFETQRQNNLKSDNSDVRSAAAVYGSPGADNGVNVSFESQAAVNQAASNADPRVQVTGHTETTINIGPGADGKYAATTTSVVRIAIGLKGKDMGQTQAHEGDHIVTAKKVAGSYNPVTNGFGFRPTVLQDETHAFTTGNSVTPYNFHGKTMEEHITAYYPDWSSSPWP